MFFAEGFRKGDIQPLFLCSAKKKPLAVKRKRQRGISISPFAIPLKRPRRGLRPPSLDFPQSLVCAEIIFGFTKRGTDAPLIDRRGHRNTLRLFRSCFVWKLVYVRYAAQPLQKDGLSNSIRQIFNGLKQNDSHGLSCDWETRFYGRPKGVRTTETKRQNAKWNDLLFRRDSAISRPQRPFLPYLFPQEGKDMARGAADAASQTAPRLRRIRDAPLTAACGSIPFPPHIFLA